MDTFHINEKRQSIKHNAVAAYYTFSDWNFGSSTMEVVDNQLSGTLLPNATYLFVYSFQYALIIVLTKLSSEKMSTFWLERLRYFSITIIH